MKKKTMLYKLTAVSACLLLAVSLMASCADGNDASESDPPASSLITEDKDIDKVVDEPTDHKEEKVSLYGKIAAVSDLDGKPALQVYTEIENYSNGFIVTDLGAGDYKIDEYIKVDGTVDGLYSKGEEFDVVDAMVVKADSIEKTTYQEAFAPAKKSVDISDASAKSGKISLAATRIEYAENETRIYVKAINKNKSGKVSLRKAQVTAKSGKKTYRYNYDSEGDYEEIGTLKAGKSKKGILCFPKMKEGKDITITQKIYTDDIEKEYKPLKIKIKLAEN